MHSSSETKTQDLLTLDKSNIWHPFTQHFTAKDHIMIEKAEGIYLYTDEGDRIIDAVSSWWVNLYGHSNPVISKAIAEQASKLEHVIFAGFTHPPAINLSEHLLAILPENQSRIFFSDNGSTSVEVGLKMAIQYWYNQEKPRKKILALEGAYHGDTFGAMAVGERNPFSRPFDEMMFEVDFLSFPNGENDKEVLEELKSKVQNSEYAAFIYEPLLQGTAGMRTYLPETLDSILDILKERKVICIADEVMTGFGRTGKYFASHYLRNNPDIVCMSKGITGGFLPLGVTSVCEPIYEVFLSTDRYKTFFHGHSYTANPISCAAAIASAQLLTSDETGEQWKMIENAHRSFKERIIKKYPLKRINILGTVLSLELDLGESSYFNQVRDIIYEEALKRKVLLRPLGNVIYVLPPYIIQKDELEEVYQVVEDILTHIDNM